MITYGTNPGMGMPITGAVPEPAPVADPLERDSHREGPRATWISKAASRCWAIPINVVFIGSCTNSRISDLRAAASRAEGPQGESEGARDGGARLAAGEAPGRSRRAARDLPRGRLRIGAKPGCSMCIAMNGDQLQPGEYSVSTSNRNFEGRQGKGGRTFLASPLTAAASALTGVVTDVRTLLMKTVHSISEAAWCRCR